MTNMITDLIRIPVDKDGVMLYDIDQVRKIYEAWHELYPEHSVFAMPANITIWEDLDITSLKSIRQFLDEIIIQKEKENNDL